MLSEDLIILNVEGDDFKDVVKNVSKKLKEKGLINEKYENAVMERETKFPTGLMTKFINVAIPHTDPEHIKQPFVCVVKTKELINMKQMGDNQEIKVKDFFFLGITEPKKQVSLLKEIMDLLMNDSFVLEYKDSNNKKQVMSTIENFYKN